MGRKQPLVDFSGASSGIEWQAELTQACFSLLFCSEFGQVVVSSRAQSRPISMGNHRLCSPWSVSTTRDPQICWTSQSDISMISHRDRPRLSTTRNDHLAELGTKQQ